MFCNHCGAQIPDDSVFCRSCGGKVERNDIPQHTEPAQFSQNEQPASQPSEPYVSPYTQAPAQPSSNTQSSLAAQAKDVRFCNSCGAQLPEGAMFCRSCGAKAADSYAQRRQPIYPTSPPQPAVKRTPPSSGVKAATVILCIFCALFVLLSSSLGILRSTLSEKRFADDFTKIDLNDVEIKKNGEDLSLAEYIYDNCDEQSIRDYGLTPDNIAQIIEKSDANQLLGDALARYSAYFIGGKALDALTVDEIMEYLYDNEGLIYRETGYRMTNADYREIRNTLDDGVGKYLSKRGMERELGVSPAVVRYPLSSATHIVCILLAVALFVLVLVVNRKNLPAALPGVGIMGIVIGALYLLSLIAGVVAILVFHSSLLNFFLQPLTLGSGIRAAVWLIVCIPLTVFTCKAKKKAA